MMSKPSTTNCPKLSDVSFFPPLIFDLFIVFLCDISILMYCILKIYQAVIAVVFHLFPFRTEKLSPLAPMVLQCNAGE